MSQVTNFIDPAVLASVDNLELRARVVVEGFLSGLHKSPHRGFSVEFTDYRHYNQGDDIRHIDWKLYARSDKLYIKQYEDETNLRCFVLLDASGSMGFSSGAVSKLEYGKTLAAALAYFMMRQRDAVGLMTFDHKVRDVLPPQYRNGHLMQILRALVHLNPGERTDAVKPLNDLAANLKSKSLVVLISDLLDGEEPTIKLLQQMRAMGHEVILFHTLDNAELNLTYNEVSNFVEMETSNTLTTSPNAIRKHYMAALQKFLDYCKSQCQSRGVDYCLLNTSEPLDKALNEYLMRRSRTG